MLPAPFRKMWIKPKRSMAAMCLNILQTVYNNILQFSIYELGPSWSLNYIKFSDIWSCVHQRSVLHKVKGLLPPARSPESSTGPLTTDTDEGRSHPTGRPPASRSELLLHHPATCWSTSSPTHYGSSAAISYLSHAISEWLSPMCSPAGLQSPLLVKTRLYFRLFFPCWIPLLSYFYNHSSVSNCSCSTALFFIRKVSNN